MSLQVQALVKHFDGVKAVNGVSFEVRTGECVALIGPNGAGKSTCFACIAGQHPLTSGQVLWNGQRIDRWPVQQRLQAGIARTFQVAQTFEALTALQNVQLAMAAVQGKGKGQAADKAKGLSAWRPLDGQHNTEARALLDQLALLPFAQSDVLGLPYGAKKRLELAIALAGIGGGDEGEGPRLLLLDEPAAGLAGAERATLMDLVKSLAHRRDALQGMAVLYTEHNMDAVFGVANRVLVLIDGQIAAEGSPEDIARNELVRSRYLGQKFEAQQTMQNNKSGHA